MVIESNVDCKAEAIVFASETVPFGEFLQIVVWVDLRFVTKHITVLDGQFVEFEFTNIIRLSVLYNEVGIWLFEQVP